MFSYSLPFSKVSAKSIHYYYLLLLFSRLELYNFNFETSKLFKLDKLDSFQSIELEIHKLRIEPFHILSIYFNLHILN